MPLLLPLRYAADFDVECPLPKNLNRVEGYTTPSRSRRAHRCSPVFWYKTLPVGHPHVRYPAFTINPPFDGDVTPAISYEVTTAKYCTGGMALLKETSSRLTLSGLPAFSCIQKADDLLSTAESQLGTDGYSHTSFCAPHAPFSWADGETQDAIESLYDRPDVICPQP